MEVFSMGVNESTSDKMKKAIKRILDGPAEEVASEENPKLQPETHHVEDLQHSTGVDTVPKVDKIDFGNMMKANLLKFKPADDQVKNDKESLFAHYNAGRKGESAMMTDTAMDNTTNIFSAVNTNFEGGTTTISKGTSIVGELHSDSDIEVLGNMKGNIITKGNVTVCGKVVGDIKGVNVEMSASNVQGNITAAGTLSIDSDSVLVGDIVSENLSIDGKLKGNAQIRNMINCQSNALVLGNVTAAVASISEGAKLQGSIQIVNGQIADIKIAEDEVSGWVSKMPSPISSIAKDK
jgi:cytoskeletal protein CcmA (bactofilin family)